MTGIIEMHMPMFWKVWAKMSAVTPIQMKRPKSSAEAKATTKQEPRRIPKPSKRVAPPKKPHCSPMAAKM